MGRRSVAEEAYQNYEEIDEADIGEGVWLMLYDFKGLKPNPRFWGNLKRLTGLAARARNYLGYRNFSIFHSSCDCCRCCLVHYR